jgi:hypothetical protein
MSCPAPERIAAAATGEDDAILLHVADCLVCQAAFEDQRAMRAALSTSTPVRLTPSHRESLAAEVMARADAIPAARRSRLPWLGVGIAAAAAIVLVIGMRSRDHAATPAIAADRSVEPVANRVIATQPDTSPPRPAPRTDQARAKLGGDGEYTRDSKHDDVVQLRGGSLTVDALDARPVRVVTGNTAIAVTRGKLRVVATRGVIQQVSVFAGSAEVTIDGKRQVIEAGMVWERDQATIDAAQVRAEALGAFRDGWTALRAGRNADAIAAFDRATDPTIAEDAVYWAAIACERTGDDQGALRRYRDLLARFPETARAPDARAAVERLEKF